MGNTDASGDFSNLSIRILKGQSKTPIGARGTTSPAFAYVLFIRSIARLEAARKAPSCIWLPGGRCPA